MRLAWISMSIILSKCSLGSLLTCCISELVLFIPDSTFPFSLTVAVPELERFRDDGMMEVNSREVDVKRGGGAKRRRLEKYD